MRGFLKKARGRSSGVAGVQESGVPESSANVENAKKMPELLNS
jgi:hypothetical protein